MTDFAAVFPRSRVAAARMQRIHVPRLRLKADLDGDAVFARLGEQVIELVERPHGERTCRLQEYLEHARPVAPDQRIGVPCGLVHIMFPVCLIRYVRRTRHKGPQAGRAVVWQRFP